MAALAEPTVPTTRADWVKAYVMNLGFMYSILYFIVLGMMPSYPRTVECISNRHCLGNSTCMENNRCLCEFDAQFSNCDMYAYVLGKAFEAVIWTTFAQQTWTFIYMWLIIKY
jgi:hypothetical protein